MSGITELLVIIALSLGLVLAAWVALYAAWLGLLLLRQAFEYGAAITGALVRLFHKGTV